MIISMVPEKTFDIIYYLFTIKALNTLGMYVYP